MIIQQMFPKGSRVKATLPTTGPDGWHHGTVIGHTAGTHVEMVEIAFDSAKLGQQQVAGIYVQQSNRPAP